MSVLDDVQQDRMFLGIKRHEEEVRIMGGWGVENIVQEYTCSLAEGCLQAY